MEPAVDAPVRLKPTPNRAEKRVSRKEHRAALAALQDTPRALRPNEWLQWECLLDDPEAIAIRDAWRFQYPFPSGAEWRAKHQPQYASDAATPEVHTCTMRPLTEEEEAMVRHSYEFALEMAVKNDTLRILEPWGNQVGEYKGDDVPVHKRVSTRVQDAATSFAADTAEAISTGAYKEMGKVSALAWGEVELSASFSG